MRTIHLLAFAITILFQTPVTKTRIVVLGDSITKGVRKDVTSDQTFASVLEKSLTSQGHAAEVINSGVGSERTDLALKRLAQDVIALKPQIVTIMYGTNDSYIDQGKQTTRLTVDEYGKNLTQIIDQLKQAGIRPIVMTPPRWGDKASLNGAGENPNVRLEPFVERCRRVAEETQSTLVDHYEIWTRARNSSTDIGAKWTTDQCHPNAEGHQQLAKALESSLSKLESPFAHAK